LVIVGEGPERSRIEHKAQQLRMEEYITFTGQQPSAQPWYGIADVAVLSSLSEGSPNALLEAMAAGVPVVATKVGGIPEIVSSGESALLVPPASVTEMADAITQVLTQPEFAAGLAAKSQDLIRTNHAPEARMRRLVSTYRSLSQRP
jgi:glycosyltransferase involved in cell wall biosynthesis